MNQPSLGRFRPLGRQLKALRDKAKETLAEASGAVEIDVRQLANYELGQSRPSEDILLLLISHFGAKDDEALRLWELAGYHVDKIPVVQLETVDKQIVSADNRILFTDIVDVVVNNYGVVMNFMQSGSPSSPPVPVAKVGMSREHAKSVLQILQITLNQTERGVQKLPKKIIAPEKKNEDK